MYTSFWTCDRTPTPTLPAHKPRWLQAAAGHQHHRARPPFARPAPHPRRNSTHRKTKTIFCRNLPTSSRRAQPRTACRPHEGALRTPPRREVGSSCSSTSTSERCPRRRAGWTETRGALSPPPAPATTTRGAAGEAIPGRRPRHRCGRVCRPRDARVTGRQLRASARSISRASRTSFARPPGSSVETRTTPAIEGWG